MKKLRIIIPSVCILLVASVVCCIVTYIKQQKNVEELNTCYELITKTVENGFDKKNASENKALFKKILENGITKKEFKKSKFFNDDISFSATNQWNCPQNRLDLNMAHCRDLVLAMYLSCILATEPENLANELEWMKDGVWQMDPKPEFMHLIATAYNPDKSDIDIIVNAILEFSQTLEHPLDEYHTRAFIYTFVNDYNETHKDDVYVLQNEEELIKEGIEISKKIAKDDFATIWVGYGKVIRLN
ncbi:MAG: hypothetical protein J6V78_00600 [Clostridia bacterium]|nr:hypothetical protein [Clostridia bacterium]